MHKAIIVEDEDIIRKGMLLAIDWNKFGFNVVSEASNGKEGLEIILKEKPDLVVTDIKMPVMDGLTMIAKAQKGHTFKAIILSSYGEFDYTKKAINLQVYDFLMKPLDETELEEILIKLQNSLNKDKKYHSFFDIEYYKLKVNNKNSYTYKVIEIIEKNYNQKLSIEQISDEFGVSNSYLSRKFKKATEHTFLEFLNKYRIEQALELMKNHELKIYEIADKTGFTDYKHFCSVFKKYLEHSPTNYIKDRLGG
ncbi:MAG: response regulator [Lachnospirales bacterium]